MPLLGNDPRRFIRNNLLMLHDSILNPPLNTLNGDGTLWVKLVEANDYFGAIERRRNRSGLAQLMPKSNKTWWETLTSIYVVMTAKETEEDRHKAYICPYGTNSTKDKMLGRDADVMFTPTLSGCTFGVGSPNNDGGVRVAHSNAMSWAEQEEGGQMNYEPQIRAQLAGLQHADIADRVLAPEQYNYNAAKGYRARGNIFMSATMGLRIGGVWEFWYQHQATDNLGNATLREKMATVKLQ